MSPDSKGSEVPLPEECDAADGDEELQMHEANLYRKLAASVNYLAMDRPELHFAASVLARTMARPTQRSRANLKRAGRCLISHPRVIFEYARVPESEVRRLSETRTRTGPGARAAGGARAADRRGVIKSWSNRRAPVALSSGEAEYYSAAKAAAEAITM